MKTDAVIVLANLMSATGDLNAESLARAQKAADEFLRRDATNLVTCGWAYRDDSDITISDAFKTYILSTSSVPADAVLPETNSRDTVGDAYFTKVKFALPRGWRKVCVVTSTYHVARAREIFEFIYGENFTIDVVGADAASANSVAVDEVNSTEAFRQTFSGVASGEDAQIWDRLRTRHPFYNGTVHPQV